MFILAAFRLFDQEDKGYISKQDLFDVLSLMAGTRIKERSLWQIVEKTFAEADLTGNGKITVKEFSSVLTDDDINIKLSLRI